MSYDFSNNSFLSLGSNLLNTIVYNHDVKCCLNISFISPVLKNRHKKGIKRDHEVYY